MPICGQIFALFGRYHVPQPACLGLVWTHLLEKEMKGKCTYCSSTRSSSVCTCTGPNEEASSMGQKGSAGTVQYILYLNKCVILPQKLFYSMSSLHVHSGGHITLIK
jgi:hypothetical protein